MTEDSSYAAKTAYRGSIAENYDEDRQGEAVWEEEQKVARKFIASLAPGTSVLDVPSGTGRFVPDFIARDLRVVAADISEDMLASLKKRYPSAGERLVTRTADAEKLPFPDDAFDSIVSWRFFHLIPFTVAENVTREFRRVCRGTVLVHVFHVQPSELGFRLKRTVKNILRPLYFALTGRRTAQRPWTHIASYSHRESDLLDMFGRCGFEVVENQTIAIYERLPVKVYRLQRRS